MDPSSFHAPELPGAPGLMAADAPARPPLSAGFALLQVVLVCGIPTQFVVLGLLLAAGSPMGADGAALTADPAKMSLQFFAMLSLFDTALVAVLIRVFLALSGETSRDVFLGRRPVLAEAGRGVALIPLLWMAVTGIVFLIGVLAPSLHNVPKNPLEAYMDSPLRAGIFIVIVTLAGGVREELQRGFILHRFAQKLGGVWVGLATYSATFGLLHLPQGIDSALAVTVLGVIWGVLYIRRRTVVPAMVSHAGFDATMVLQQLLVRTMTS